MDQLRNPDRVLGGSMIAPKEVGWPLDFRWPHATAICFDTLERNPFELDVQGSTPNPQAAAWQLTNLTQREHEVLGLLSKGHPDKDIADQLGISIHTIHEHVRNVFEKLGAHNRTEAAVKFLQK